MEPILQSQFADDTFLFGEATVREEITIRKVLDCFEADSSQNMNKNKSMVFFLKTNRRLRSRISEILEFEPGEFPITYLGVPLFAGRVDKTLWEEVINRCHLKVAS